MATAHGPAGWSTASSIDDVLERMDAIAAAHPGSDGVATFDRMYRQVTRLVQEAELADRFGAGEFIARLDVHFANLFFAAYEADVAGTEVPEPWAPLFEARAKPDTHPVQFALAGMNAHIAHDLSLAVVTTCRELGVEPDDETPEHADFTLTNDVLRDAAEQIKGWFASGIVATVDRLGGRVDDGLAMFALHTGRAAAWETAEVLWGLEDNPRVRRLFVGGLARGVALTSRGILL